MQYPSLSQAPAAPLPAAAKKEKKPTEKKAKK
jgi:hypothetical protein